MAEKPKAVVHLDEWGLVSNRSPHKAPAAPVVLDNCESLSPGRLTARRGLKQITFSNSTTAVTDDIIAMQRFQTTTGDWIIYETSAGAVKIGRDPS